MHKRLSCLTLSLYIFCITYSSAEEALSTPYVLGTDDRVQIKVYDLRSGAGEAYQWSALNGEFIVDASGSLSVPLVGEIQAKGQTTAAISNIIAEKLQRKVGLAQKPDASVQVTKYRPFYIIGDVERPGEFDFRPGLTVLQAIGVAGGLFRTSSADQAAIRRELISQHGEVRLLKSEIQALEIRKSRLSAEISNSPTMNTPIARNGVLPQTQIVSLTDAEKALFETNKNSASSQIVAVEQAKKILIAEIDSLEEKNGALLRQSQIAQKDLSQINELMTRGLAVNPRQLAAEQAVAGYESNILETRVAKLRSQQELSKTERELIVLRDKRKSEALVELGEVERKISDATQRLNTANDLAELSRLRSASLTSSDENPDRLEYSVTRIGSLPYQNFVVDAYFKIMPGDVVSVRQRRAPSANQGE